MSLTTLVSLAGGLFLLYVGAEGLVRGSASLALRLGLTRLVIGLTIVAFGTSSPEFVVSLKAALEGNGAISIGNVVGSNICNIALILGLSALVSPLRINAQVVRIQIPIMIAVGNIVGSNIFNILAILGFASLLRPIEMSGIQTTDLIVMVVTAVLTFPMARSGFLLTRWEGAVLLAIYCGYIFYLLPTN